MFFEWAYWGEKLQLCKTLGPGYALSQSRGKPGIPAEDKKNYR